MIVARTITELREALLSARIASKRIGLVPTMGAFHAGHLHLMHTAREDCDIAVVSLFVNPTQFGDASDLSAYPVNFDRDAEMANTAGIAVLFAPSVSEMYPAGFNTSVHVDGVTVPLEGAARGVEHFRGVATVVAKLLNIVQPHQAYFGQKDAQQVAVVKQLARDLNLPVEIVVCTTVRENDGLAMSSRNVRLSPQARAQALGLSQALLHAERLVTAGNRSPGEILAAARQDMTSRDIHSDDIEYFDAVDNNTLQSLEMLTDEPVLFVVAARVGGVRLIDNVLVHPTQDE